MADIIVLDKITAGQIAAGEVVERPVSAVKELVENALDAGASKITVDLTDGGLSKIIVTDNGCGISPEDVRVAFLRHATSKIRGADDLLRVHTLGFRGEALPSIAAVAKVEMITRMSEAITGTCVRIQGGTPAVLSSVGCAAGTRVKIKELFYNTPVRRKSMKTPSVEGALCSELLSKMALSRPNVRFELLTNGRRVFYTPGSGKLLDAVAAVYGPGQSKEMLGVEAEDGDIDLAGYIGKPALSRSSRTHQTIIINGRYVRCPVVTATVESIYRSLLSPGRKPVFILSLNVAPDQLDVNIHPAKLEVRLLEEKRVVTLVARALNGVLRGDVMIPAALRERGNRVSLPAIQPENREPDHQQDLNRHTKLTKEKAVSAGDTIPVLPETRLQFTKQNPDQENLAQKKHGAIKGSITLRESNNKFFPYKTGESIEQKDPGPVSGGHAEDLLAVNLDSVMRKGGAKEPEKKLPSLYPLSQLHSSYILAEGEDGLYIIDQHAAHERVLYEECLSGQGDFPSQYLLIPETLELEYGESAAAAELLPRFSEAGFVIEHFGGKTFLLRGAPSYLPAGRAKELFLDMLDFYKSKSIVPEPAEFFKRLAASLACKAAVKAGDKMPYKAMEALLVKLARTENPFTCPHGRPTVIHLSQRDLRTRFQR